MAKRSQKPEARSQKPGTAAVSAASRDRACLRCGCTESKPCPQVDITDAFRIVPCGCAWVANTDVCSACITAQEFALYQEFEQEIEDAKPGVELQRACNRMKTFGKFITELSYDLPIPYIPVKAALAIASRKASITNSKGAAK